MGGFEFGHVLEVHAKPAADHDRGQRDGGEGGEEFDAFIGLEGGFVEIDVERHHEALMVAGGGVLEADEVVAQVAKVRQEFRPDELAVAAREPVDDVALGPDDRAEFGEIAADVEEFVDEFFLGGLAGEDVLLEFLEFGAEFLDDGGVVVDEEIEEGVGDAVGPAGADGGALELAVDEGRDGAERGGVEGDEVVAAEEEIELGGVELVGTFEIDGVGDDEEVVLVVLDLGEGAGGDAVLDGERVKLEDGFEDEFGFFLGGVVEVDPEEQALVGADEAEGFAFEVLADEFAVAEDEGADHRGGAWDGRRRFATKRRGERRENRVAAGCARRPRGPAPELQPEFFLHRGEGGDEGFGGFGGEEGGAVGRVAEQFAEGADDGEVVAGFRLGGAEDEEEFHDLAVGVERDAGVAAADGEDDLLDVLGAGVGEGDGVAEAGGVEAVAGEEFFVEAGVVGDVDVAIEEAGDLVERGGALGALNAECDAGGSEERGDFAGHAKEAENERRTGKGESRKAPAGEIPGCGGPAGVRGAVGGAE